MISRIQIIVSGRVQGVCFRAATLKQAGKLSIKGFVRNLPDGRVEIVGEGTDDALQKLVNWSHNGPMMAKVETVVTENFAGIEQFNAFEVR